MARRRMVTRTVVESVATVMMVDTTTAQVYDAVDTATGMEYDNDFMLKHARKALETERFKVVMVREVMYRETLYGMPEEEFIKLAHIMPDRA